jgi:hypothetical protein
MARAAHRFRKCPKCKQEFPAGKLRVCNPYHGQHYHKVGGSLRRCPHCGKVGFTQDFKIVGGV